MAQTLSCENSGERMPVSGYKLLALFGMVCVSLWLQGNTVACGQSALKMAFSANGLQKLTYRNVTLEDLTRYPEDSFHIWHMKMRDMKGNVLSSGQYGWGENNNGKTWNPASQSWSYSFVWGIIRVRYQQVGDGLDLIVTQTNNSNSGVILDGASVFPLALHFPQLPTGFADASYPQLSDNVTGPSVLAADYGTGMVAAVSSSQHPLYSGFMPAGQPAIYSVLMSTTTPDGLASFRTQIDRPLLPGHSNMYTVSLRFAASGTALPNIANDVFQNWASMWPPALTWSDRRIIGTAYLASSPNGNASQPGGFPNNPRRYFNDSSSSDFDVTTAGGLVKFQARILAQAVAIVQNLQRMNAQGAITWDIEGEQYPQPTSYVCSPDQIATIAPEMESIVQDSSSPYAGLKLDDAYFKTIRDAGYRVGVCVRPQTFKQSASGTAQQAYIPSDQVASAIIRKMKYAHDRWGATLFYLDSTVEQNGAVLDASIFQQAAAALPDSLLMPEESTPKYFAYTAAFQNFLFLGQLGTDPGVYSYYPQAFSAILVNDVDAGKLQAAQSTLIDRVRRGDVLMVHADYWQANNPTVMDIYTAAASQGALTDKVPRE